MKQRPRGSHPSRRPTVAAMRLFGTLVLTFAYVWPGAAAAATDWINIGRPGAASVSTIGWSASDSKIGYAVTFGATAMGGQNIAAINAVYRTDNGGEKWRQASTLPFVKDTQFLGVLVEANNPDVVLISAIIPDEVPVAIMFRSADGGRTWIMVQQYTTGSFSFQAISDALTPNIMYSATSALLGEGGEMMVSADGGATFTYVADMAWPLLSVNQSGTSMLYGVYTKPVGNSLQTLVRSPDHGATQTILTLPPFDPTEDFFALAVDPSNSETIYALTAFNYPPGTAETAACRLYKTADGGNSWALVATKGGIIATNCGPESLSVDPRNPAHLVIAQAYDVLTTPPILESFDGGISWHGARQNVLSVSAWQLAAAPNADPSNAALWAATPEGAFRSTDWGATWELNDDGMARPFIPQIVGEPAPSTRIYAATQGGVFAASTQVPTPWTPVSHGLESLNITSLALDSTASPNVLYATTDVGLFASSDQGANWTEVSGPCKHQGYSFITVDAKTAGLLYLVGFANEQTGGGPLSFVSHDAGLTWNHLAFDKGADGGTEGILPDPMQAGVVYVWSFGRMLKSVDSGQSFSRVHIPGSKWGDVSPITILPPHGSGPERLIGLSCNQDMCVSRDGGRHWKETGLPPSGTDSALLAADPDGGKIYIGALSPNEPLPMEESTNAGATFRKIAGGLPPNNIGPWIASDYLFATSSEDGSVFLRPLTK
jgi:photosystem II stability/assembly factor-like uncharacterized protein